MEQAAAEAPYSPIAKLFHWLVVALVVIQFTIAWTMPDIHRGTPPVGLIGWHLSVGASILAIAVMRLSWRFSHPAPAPPDDLPTVVALLSRGTHFALYALMIILPIMGWANASARGWAVRIFGVIPLPQIVQTASPLGRRMGNIHATTAIIFVALIVLHVSGALYHALILRDRVLRRMT